MTASETRDWQLIQAWAGLPDGKGRPGPLTARKIIEKAGIVRGAAAEPPWLIEARRHMGLCEIPGPRHNNFIAKGWARLGAGWFNDDETPWCGFFVAHCIDAAGLPWPERGLFARARAWLDYGRPCAGVPGAIAVFGRSGGGHVGFAVGQSASSIYVLGGNQANAVNIMPIGRNRLLGYRWPSGSEAGRTVLPTMSGGTLSRNEA